MIRLNLTKTIQNLAQRKTYEKNVKKYEKHVQ